MTALRRRPAPAVRLQRRLSWRSEPPYWVSLPGAAEPFSSCASGRSSATPSRTPHCRASGLAFIIMVALGGDGRNLRGFFSVQPLSAGLGLLVVEWITPPDPSGRGCSYRRGPLGVLRLRYRAADDHPDHAPGQTGRARGVSARLNRRHAVSGRCRDCSRGRSRGRNHRAAAPAHDTGCVRP